MKNLFIISVVLGFWSCVVQGQGCKGPCVAGTCPANLTCLTNVNLCCGTVATTTAAPCADVAPNCAPYRYLCDNFLYHTLMTSLCARTCCRCNPPCVDRTNPSTGTSDCPIAARFCNHTLYYDMMTEYCPRTCGRCTMC